MIDKNFLIWVNVLLFLGLLLILFEIYEKDPMYEDPVLSHLGMSKEDVIDKYGEPGFEGDIGGPGGKEFFYEEKNISFIFAGDEGVVNNLRIFPEKEILEVEVGMKFEEIIEVLGEPREMGFDSYTGRYTLVYFLGEELNGMGEVEVWFSASEEGASTEEAEIFWKKYWY